jgi:carbamoyl-phosphate synthase small subunit
MPQKSSAIITPKLLSKSRPKKDDSFALQDGYLTLSDGTVMSGQMPRWQDSVYPGEVVFNTGMTGYVESLTDPSYAGQILVFTYPLIGNYGVSTASGESGKVQAAGVIVSEATAQWSHVASDRSLLQWLREQNVPILTGVDTRVLTKHLRQQGTMAGAIGVKRASKRQIVVPKQFVSVSEPQIYNPDYSKTVIVVDCGAKENIIRSLMQLPVRIKRVPHDYDYSNEAYDGVVLSNGPGDPTDYQSTVVIARQALAKGKPMFGICLGNQIMALATGAKTYKLKFGHRGHNQPCLESTTNHGYITSQNHSYSIDEKSLPKDWVVTFRNLNDGSVEGIQHRSKPFFSVQFHPEACPGPTDTAWLFERFYDSL